MNMYRIFPVLPFLICLAAAKAEEPQAPSILFEKIDRTIHAQPEYESTPKYCLLILGANGNVKVWMVEDGKRLYIDKNANGDLTDDGPPVEPSDTRSLGDERWDFNYLVDAFTAGDGSRHTDFDLRRWNYGGKDDSYGLSLSLDGRLTKGNSPNFSRLNTKELTFSLTGPIPMYAGWFGTFWSSEPGTAPVIHFGGPLTPKMLREKEFVIGSGQRRLSMAFTNPGSGRGAVSRLSIDALPAHVIPRLVIEWPTVDKGRSLRTSHDLIDRCCYWEFYTTEFEVPDGICVGTAQVSVQFPDFEFPLELTTTMIEVAVVATASKSEE